MGYSAKGMFPQRQIIWLLKLQTLLAASAGGAVRRGAAQPHNNGELVNGKVFDASESEALRPRPRLRLRLRFAQQRGRHPTCFPSDEKRALSFYFQ